jgi:hypothetical protein
MRFAFCVGILLTQGCGSGGGAGQDLAAPDLATTVPTASVTGKPDLVGFVSMLDGSGSTDPLGRPLTFKWRILSVPGGSAIADSSLSSTSGSVITFEPDLGGDYQFQLDVTSDGGIGTIAAKITVPTVPIYYHQGVFANGGLSAAAGVMRSDGTGAHLLSCPVGTDGGASIFGWAFGSMFSVSAFEPPLASTTPARFAFSEIVGTDNRLLIADEQSDCTTHAPPRIDPSSDLFYSQHPHRWPRFSPDGSRVLYVDNPASPPTSQLVSVSVDGSNVRVIRTNANLSSAPPVWVDATHVAWVEETGTMMAPKPVIYQASDASFAGDSATAPGDRVALVDCSGVLTVINQFAVVTTNSTSALVVAGGIKRKVDGGSLDLYRMIGGTCSLATPLATEPPDGDAGDFAVSPDGATILLSTTHGQSIPDGGPTPQHDLFKVPSDGSAPLVKFAGDPLVDDLGPHWLAGGRQVWWTQGAITDGGVAGGGIVIANADGTHVRALRGETTAGGVSTVVLAGSNSGVSCAYGGALFSVSGTLLLVAMLLGFWYARRAKGD